MADAKRLIGAVGIKVRPVTDGFRKEVEDDLRRLKDAKVNVKVDADTTAAERKIKKATEDKNMTLRVGVTYDEVKQAEAKLNAMLRNVRAKEIPVKVDEAGLKEALNTLHKIQEQSSVVIKVNEDKEGYEAALRKIRAVQREKALVGISFETDDLSLSREAAKYERKIAELTQPREISISFGEDRDDLAKALAQVESELANIREVKVPITADLASLENTRDSIKQMMDARPAVVKFTNDEEGYKAVLKKIAAIRKEKILKEVEVFADERKLDELEYEMNQNLESLKENAKITVEWSNDTFKMRESLRQIDDAIKDLSKVELDVELTPDDLARVKKEVERELGNTKFEVEFTEDADGLKKARSRVQELLNPIVKQTLTIDPDQHSLEKTLADIDEMIRKAEAKKVKVEVMPSGLEATAAQLAWVSRARTVPLYVRVSEKSLAIAEGALKSLSGYNTLTSMGRGLENLITNFDSIMLKTAAISTVVGGLVNTVTYAGTAALGIADGMSRSVGLLATGPAALTAITAGVLVNIAAFKDFKAGIDGNAEALAALPPNARAAAVALQGTWTAIQKPIQMNYWEAMGSSLKDMSEVLLPQVGDGLAKVATHAGRFGSITADALKELALAGAIALTLDNVSALFDNATGAARPFVEAIGTLGLRGSEYLPQFGTWLTKLSERFNNFIQEADSMGRINQWIEEGVQSLKDMWSAGDGIVDMLRGITQAAMSAGTNDLGTFADNMQRMGEIALSEPFQSRLATIFEGARKGASELNVGVKDLGRSFGESAPFISDVLVLLGQLGGTVLTNIAKMFSGSGFQGGILSALEGLRDMTVALLPSFQDLGRLIGSLGEVAKSTFIGLAPIINTVTGALAQVADALEDELPQAASVLLAYMNNTFSSIASVVVPVAEALGNVLGIFNDLPSGVQRTLIAFGAFTLMRSQVASLFTTLSNTKAFQKMEQNWRMQRSLAGDADAATRQFVAGTYLMDQSKEKVGGIAETFRRISAESNTAGERVKNLGKAMGGGLVTAGKSLFSLMGGPWGVALGAAAVGLSLYGQKQAEAKAQVDAHTSALDEQTGAIGEANASLIAARLASDGGSGFFGNGAEGAAETIKALGRSVQDTSRIVAEGGSEYESMIDQIDRGIGAYKQAASSVDELGRPIKGNTEAVEAWAKEMGVATDAVNAVDLIRLKDMLVAEHAAVERSVKLWGDRNDAVRSDGIAGITEGMAASIKVLGDSANDAEVRLRAYRDILDELNGVSKSSWERQRDLSSTFRDMAGFLSEVDEAGNRLNTGLVDLSTGFTIHTEAGDRFGTMLDDLQRQAQSAGQQAYDAAGGINNAGEAAAAAAAATAPYRDEIQKLVAMQLISQEEADALTRALLGVPGRTPFELTDEGSIETVKLQLQGLVDRIETTPDKEITITEPLSPGIIKGLEALGFKVTHLPGGLIRVGEQGTRQTGDYIDATAGKKRTAQIDAVAITSAAETALSILAGTKRYATIEAKVKTSQANGGLYVGQPDGSVVRQFADGGIMKMLSNVNNVHRFANGGTENHVAQIARGQTPYRVWAEPETGGEAYLPLSVHKRARSTTILNQVATMFGYQLVKNGSVKNFADGGIVDGGSTGSGVSVNIGSYVTQQSDTPDDVARALMRRIKAQGAYSPLEAF